MKITKTKKSTTKSKAAAVKKVEFSNTEKAQINTNQSIFDAFNSFIFSDDTKVLGKLAARTLLAERTRHIPGDIVEVGVFKGSGLLTWLKLKKLLFPNSMKKVIGFDFFDTKSLVDSLSGIDKLRMGELFTDRNFKHEKNASKLMEGVIENAGFSPADYELVAGDIMKTAKEFAEKRPGFKISILYLDLDIEEPTYAALEALWDRVSRGGLVVFDEYAYHQWSESIAVDRFFADKKVEIKILDFMCPTAYIVKE
jgi:hypothetical protein